MRKATRLALTALTTAVMTSAALSGCSAIQPDIDRVGIGFSRGALSAGGAPKQLFEVVDANCSRACLSAVSTFRRG